MTESVQSRTGMRLVADIGGTNVRFALLPSGSTHPQQEKSLLCSGFPDLEQAARHYLAAAGVGAIDEAAVDVATAITGDVVKLTNSPWVFSIEQTRRALGLTRLLVINDFTALALSLPLLRPDELRPVGGGSGLKNAPVALIGAGTGLGVSALIPCGGHWVPIQGEGGHTAFSPMDEREDGVLKVLRGRYGHVSTERLASGPGLVATYEALCALSHTPPKALKPEQVAETGLNASDPQCAEALRMFCAVLGTAAANLVVTLGARGGVYIGGGIVPRLGDYFLGSPFRARFEQKGRFSSYVSQVPVWIILAENPALRGLASALESGFTTA
ncbi:MAG TPA: glucokinase [Burkholderiales bacterium]|nr:glucokinase [Burkholderiales bacterium]